MRKWLASIGEVDWIFHTGDFLSLKRKSLVKNKPKKAEKGRLKIKEYVDILKEKASWVFWIPGNHDPLDFHESLIEFEGATCV